MRVFATIAALILFAGACDSDSPTAPQDGPFELQTLAKVSQSAYTAPALTTIRSAEEWSAAWAALYAGLQPVPTRPEVDFGHSYVVLAAAGTRPDGCYSIEISSVQPSIEGQPVFDVVETRPGPSCVCTQAITRPAHAVRVTRFSGDAEFLERTTELAC